MVRAGMAAGTITVRISWMCRSGHADLNRRRVDPLGAIFLLSSPSCSILHSLNANFPLQQVFPISPQYVLRSTATLQSASSLHLSEHARPSFPHRNSILAMSLFRHSRSHPYSKTTPSIPFFGSLKLGQTQARPRSQCILMGGQVAVAWSGSFRKTDLVKLWR